MAPEPQRRGRGGTLRVVADSRGSGSRSGGRSGGKGSGGSRANQGSRGQGGGRGGKGRAGGTAGRGTTGGKGSTGSKGSKGGNRSGQGSRGSQSSRGGQSNRGNSSRRVSSKKSDRAEWGSLTRKGASYIEGRQEPSGYVEPERENNDIDARIREEAKEAIDRGSKKAPKKARRNERSKLPKVPLALDDTAAALNRAMGKTNGAKALDKLGKASLQFADERFADARRTIKPIVEAAPDVAEVRELHGLILYRLARWKEAARELEAFREQAGTTEQHPVLADCYRAVERWDDVEELWHELKEASPSASLVTEGRIVAAGAHADRGDFKAAIALLEQGWKQPKRAKDHHLSRAYALADLYERAGRTARARDLFGWISRQPGEFADVPQRVNALS